MNVEQMIAELQRAGLYEVCHKTSFTGYRKDKNGETQEVEVDILDAGLSINPQYRYTCRATTKDGKMATGNPMPSAEDAISHAHWVNLDR